MSGPVASILSVGIGLSIFLIVAGAQAVDKCGRHYRLAETHRGQEIVGSESTYWFFRDNDPTGGNVDYQGFNESKALGLAWITATGGAGLKVDSTSIVDPSARGRKSTRVTTHRGYSEALWIFDVNHMPEGCGTWPALWTVGNGNWPDKGEIDLIEGANNQVKASMSLHTLDGCTMEGANEVLKFDGHWEKPLGSHKEMKDCYHQATPDNVGCRIESVEDVHGKPFNAVKGGILVLELHRRRHVRMWYFKRDEIPQDIIDEKPRPETWRKLPMSVFPFGPNCDGVKYFADQRIVINTTLCGGFAGNQFTGPMGCPGNGIKDCEKYVRENPGKFKSAYWDIESIKIYEPINGQEDCSTPPTDSNLGQGSSSQSAASFWGLIFTATLAVVATLICAE